MSHANVIIIAGPNGAGKTTAAPALLNSTIEVSDFVNADIIAHGLSFFKPEEAELQAGRIMLSRLKELASQNDNFAFETTLASRTFASWIAKLRNNGYLFHLFFLWLPSEEFAIQRVEKRVLMGGHNVPEETIRRRYHRGLKNFFKLYSPIAHNWYFFDASARLPKLIAYGQEHHDKRVAHPAMWERLKGSYK